MPGPLALLVEQVQFEHFLLISTLTILSLVAYSAYGLYTSWKARQPYPDLPILTLDGLSPAESWQKGSLDLIKKGLEHDGNYQIMTSTGPCMILKTKYADEVKTHEDLSISGSMKTTFFGTYPGFQAITTATDHADLIRDTITFKLTGALGSIMPEVVEETTLSFEDVLGKSKEWKSLKLHEDISILVTRISSRIFVGLPLCRDQRFLDVERNYVSNMMIAVWTLGAVPAITRPISHWFLPACRRLRKDYNDAKSLIEGDMRRRYDVAKAAKARGEKLPKFADSMSWFVETAEQRKHHLPDATKELVGFQLSLSGAAIHTTTHTLSQTLTYLLRYPQYIPTMREEAIAVLGDRGWDRNSLQQLKFMDSFIKETQRLTHKPVMLRRTAKKDVQFADGTKIPKNASIQVESKHFNTDIYPDPLSFDPHRFLIKREGHDGMKWHLVATTGDMMGFGYGPRACPGRFFAATEIKVVLVHLLMNYDIDVDPEFGSPVHMVRDGQEQINPLARLRYRKREAEIDTTRVV